MDYTVHGNLQARILEWVAFPFSKGSSQPMDQTQISLIAGGFFTSWAKRETQELEWVAYPFSSGSSPSRNRTGVSCNPLQVDSLRTIREAITWMVDLYPWQHLRSRDGQRLERDAVGGKREMQSREPHSFRQIGRATSAQDIFFPILLMGSHHLGPHFMHFSSVR